MNERIQELSYQCWYNDPDTGNPLKREVALETAHDLADMILEHFGVEE